MFHVEHDLTHQKNGLTPIMEELQQCPSCSSSTFTHFLTCKDFTYSQNTFRITECVNCGLRFTNPRPSQSEIGKYYDSADYVSHNDTDRGLMFTAYQIVKRFTLKSKTNLIKSYCNEGIALDYGAGTGDFADSLRRSGFNASAIEPDQKAKKRILTKYPGLKLIEGIDAEGDGSLQVITLWHVLEHIHTLKHTLLQFHKKLHQEGMLIIAVPNCDSFDAAHYKEFWAAYDLPRHLYHFTPQTINTLFDSTGFILVETRPMWFDSFYVSLLSAQYKHPYPTILRKIINLVTALATGTISNFCTLINKRRCSSLIYILKKR